MSRRAIYASGSRLSPGPRLRQSFAMRRTPRRSGLAWRRLLLAPFQRAQGRDIALVLRNIIGEDMAAAARGDKIDVVAFFRMQHGGNGILAGIADRPRRQAGKLIGVVRRGAVQLALADAVTQGIALGQAIDD